MTSESFQSEEGQRSMRTKKDGNLRSERERDGKEAGGSRKALLEGSGSGGGPQRRVSKGDAGKRRLSFHLVKPRAEAMSVSEDAMFWRTAGGLSTLVGGDKDTELVRLR